MLVTGSHGLVLPLSTNQTGVKHEEHQQKPASQGAQQPAEPEHDFRKEEEK